MSKIIYKYNLPALNCIKEITVRRYAKALHVGLDPCNNLCIWFELELEQPEEHRTPVSIGTGIPFEEEFDSNTVKYIGSLSTGPFMHHIYQLGGSS